MKKILIVDDEPMMLKLAKKVLQNQYQTVLASSGEEAVELFVKEEPDMVLSDLQMPNMSGYDLQNAIRQQSTVSVPFIFMTADDSDESESRGFDEGAADYIRKPIKADLLIKRIERIFQNVDEAQRLRIAANTDSMTGLLNKAASRATIEPLCLESQGALLIIDLDSFKLVNDIYGHDAGDHILTLFSQLLKSVLRENDVCGRIGGDEFVAFCQNLRSESAIAKKAEYLNSEILRSAKALLGDGMDIPLGVSIGAVFTESGIRDYDTLFQRADAALYRTKQAGKHGYHIYEKDSSDETADAGDFKELRMIFGERSLGRGAWVVERETFTSIYRFLNRFLANYPWSIHIVSFTLVSDTETDLVIATDLFLELSRQILRTSDILLRHKPNQVLALWMKVDEDSFLVPLARVLETWQEKGTPGVSVSYETEKLNRD